jgi:hypothetical protein
MRGVAFHSASSVARGATSINHVSGADGQICKSSRGDTKMPLLADSLRSLHASITVFAIVVAGLALGRDILLPMALAIVIAFALAQIVTRLSVLGLPHAASASLVRERDWNNRRSVHRLERAAAADHGGVAGVSHEHRREGEGCQRVAG